MMIAELSEQFFEHGRYLRNWSPKTVSTYQQNLATLRQAIGENPPTQEQPAGVRRVDAPAWADGGRMQRANPRGQLISHMAPRGRSSPGTSAHQSPESGVQIDQHVQRCRCPKADAVPAEGTQSTSSLDDSCCDARLRTADRGSPRAGTSQRGSRRFGSQSYGKGCKGTTGADLHRMPQALVAFPSEV